jgi:hypothetical protein
VDYFCNVLDASQFDSVVRITSHCYPLALPSNHPAVHIHYKINIEFPSLRSLLISLISLLLRAVLILNSKKIIWLLSTVKDWDKFRTLSSCSYQLVSVCWVAYGTLNIF